MVSSCCLIILTGFLQGSSKSGYLGEAAIDFSDFAAVTEPLTVSLPLKFANSGAILHVSTLYHTFHAHTSTSNFLMIHHIAIQILLI